MPFERPVTSASTSAIFGSKPYSNVQLGASTTPSTVMNSCTCIAPIAEVIAHGARACCAASPGTSLRGAKRRIEMAKDHGSSVKNDKQYEGLRKKGMNKSRAAAISNANSGSDNAASKKGGKNSGGGKSSGSSQSSKSSGSGSGGNRSQKQAAGRKGGKATASKS